MNHSQAAQRRIQERVVVTQERTVRPRSCGLESRIPTARTQEETPARAALPALPGDRATSARLMRSRGTFSEIVEAFSETNGSSNGTRDPRFRSRGRGSGTNEAGSRSTEPSTGTNKGTSCSSDQSIDSREAFIDPRERFPETAPEDGPPETTGTISAHRVRSTHSLISTRGAV